MKLTEIIDKLRAEIEEASESKQDAFDNKSEKWQESEKWEEAQSNIDRMVDCASELQNALDCISEFTEE